MSNAGWIDVWNLVLTVTSHEPAPSKILIGLGIAFCVVMFLEGIYGSFLPVRYASSVARKYLHSNLPRQRSAQTHGPAQSQVYETRPFKAALPKRAAPQILKRRTARISRHQAPKPRIRRMPMVNTEQTFQRQELPSFSPLPPADPQVEL